MIRNRTVLSEPENNKIWLKQSENNGKRLQIYAWDQQIEQCEASEKLNNACENKKNRTWQERVWSDGAKPGLLEPES